MAISIDGNTIPASMSNRGNYRFPAAELLRRDGEGLGISAPTRAIEWIFPYMTATELSFWTSTVLGGAASKKCTGTNVFNDPTAGGAEITFSFCILDRPTMSTSPRGGHYRNVTINIRSILA